MKRSGLVAALLSVACAGAPRGETPAPVPQEPIAVAPARPVEAEPTPPPPATPAPVPVVAPAWLSHDESGVRFDLKAEGVTRVGRLDPETNSHPDIDVRGLAEGDTVSRRHAEIVRRGGTWVLFVQPTTTNETLLNGRIVAAGTATELHEGDVLYLGGLRLVFHAASEPEP